MVEEESLSTDSVKKDSSNKLQCADDIIRPQNKLIKSISGYFVCIFINHETGHVFKVKEILFTKSTINLIKIDLSNFLNLKFFFIS